MGGVGHMHSCMAHMAHEGAIYHFELYTFPLSLLLYTMLPTVPDSFSTYISLPPPPFILPLSAALQGIGARVEHVFIGPLHCH